MNAGMEIEETSERLRRCEKRRDRSVDGREARREGGGIDGDGNIDDDPLFIDRFLGDLNLDSKSPCIDTGNPDNPSDEDDSRADMGALPFFAVVIEFKRGDSNSDGSVAAIPDGLFLLKWAFQSGDEPACMAAADADGSGAVNGLTDGLFLFRWAFQSGDAPPDPGPDECGPIDEEEDASCDEQPACE